MRNEDPEHFQKAIDFDEELRRKWNENRGGMRMSVFINVERRPLREIDFDSEEDKGQQLIDFQSECEGMCGL
jgi:hypothetical protein